jgi:pimeloyl-ACP methyl ester carboxylesterase
VQTSYGVGLYRASESHLFCGRRTYKPDGTRTAVLYCPSRDNTSLQAAAVGWIDPVIRAVAEAGYPILSADMGGLTTFGNAACSTAVGEARTYVNSAFGGKISAGVFLIGTSMGGLTALRYAKDNPSLVKGIVAGVPAIDLQDIHDVTRPDLAATIEAAHGGLAGYNTYLADHNPADHTSSFTSMPMQLHYATNDTSITSSTVTSFASATGAEAISLGAVGHSPYTMDTGRVLTFLDELA